MNQQDKQEVRWKQINWRVYFKKKEKEKKTANAEYLLNPQGKYFQQPYKSPWSLALGKHTRASKTNLVLS